ncbi:MAG: serine O-acetyltransferase EpsC [Chloroflexota bacterium]
MSNRPDDHDEPPRTLAELAEHIAADQATVYDTLPDRDLVAALVDRIVGLLFPDGRGGRSGPRTAAHVQDEFDALHAAFVPVLRPLENLLPDTPHALCDRFLDQLPAIHEALSLDVAAIEAGDPAAHGSSEIVLAYPGFTALAFHRIAHALHREGIPLVPRMISEVAHGRTGIDIHPGATIGRSCCIDHGTGLVIGETAVIGDNVKLYQGVTLGALSVSKDKAGSKRHPTIEAGTVIYANATVLGGDTVVGHDSIIGGSVWLTHSVPPNSLVYHQSQVRVRAQAEVADPTDFVI